MTEAEFKHRTKQVALRVIRLVNTLPTSGVAGVIGKQLVRSGTSIGANYRAACRAKSRRDFVAKMGIVEEEADESALWMELIIESGLKDERLVIDLLREANEITKIMAASKITARGRNKPDA